ncbi:MAG: glycosyltransferase family 2 protein [Sphingobacteriaceae bacterium]
MKAASLSVIIPNYNGKNLLQANLPSVFAALEHAAIPYEVLVVDDCSTDDSVAFLQKKYPEVKLLVKEKNSGFSTTCNMGIRKAKNDYILLLNTDIKLPKNYLDGQFDYFKSADTFGVMAQIRGAKNGEIQDSARLFSVQLGKLKPNTFFHVVNPSAHIPTAYLSGANALVDAEKLKVLGGFNESFSPFYYEDFDLGLRAWRLGWKCYYYPDRFCLHDHAATTKNYRTKNWVKGIYFRNKLMVQALHLSGLQKAGWYLRTFLETCVMWLFGNFYFYGSLTQFFAISGEIKRAKTGFSALQKKYKSTRSLANVQQEMKALLVGQNVQSGRGKA